VEIFERVYLANNRKSFMVYVVMAQCAADIHKKKGIGNGGNNN